MNRVEDSTIISYIKYPANSMATTDNELYDQIESIQM